MKPIRPMAGGSGVWSVEYTTPLNLGCLHSGRSVSVIPGKKENPTKPLIFPVEPCMQKPSACKLCRHAGVCSDDKETPAGKTSALRTSKTSPEINHNIHRAAFVPCEMDMAIRTLQLCRQPELCSCEQLSSSRGQKKMTCVRSGTYHLQISGKSGL